MYIFFSFLLDADRGKPYVECMTTQAKSIVAQGAISWVINRRSSGQHVWTVWSAEDEVLAQDVEPDRDTAMTKLIAAITEIVRISK